MTGVMVLVAGVCVALAYSVVRVFLDFRARRYGWACAGLAVSLLLLSGLLAPVQTHAVKVVLLPADR